MIMAVNSSSDIAWGPNCSDDDFTELDKLLGSDLDLHTNQRCDLSDPFHPGQQHQHHIPYHGHVNGADVQHRLIKGPVLMRYWPIKDVDTSYHTAVDTTIHPDLSLHHVDSSTHQVETSSHGAVDVSENESASVLDASGHDSAIDISCHGGDAIVDEVASKGSTDDGRKGSDDKDGRVMEHSCEACKRSKKRCNRRNPCQICTARGIECVPQIRGPGRPPGSKSRSASSHSLSIQTNLRGMTRGDPMSRSASMGQLGNAVKTLNRDAWHCRFFMESARHCIEAFLKAWHENQLDTQRCGLLRNLWSKISSRVDVTFGILDRVCDAVGSPAYGLPSQSPTTRSRSTAVEKAQMVTHPRSKEGMGPWCLPEELRKLDDGSSMICAWMHVNDELSVYTSRSFEETFLSRHEIISKADESAVLPILLLATIFHPDDLPDAYSAIGMYWFRLRPPPDDHNLDNAEAFWICNCIDRRNSEFLALARFRQVLTPPDSEFGAAILSVRRLPERYLRGVGSFHDTAVPHRGHRDTLGALPMMDVTDAIVKSAPPNPTSYPFPSPCGNVFDVHVSIPLAQQQPPTPSYQQQKPTQLQQDHETCLYSPLTMFSAAIAADDQVEAQDGEGERHRLTESNLDLTGPLTHDQLHRSQSINTDVGIDGPSTHSLHGSRFSESEHSASHRPLGLSKANGGVPAQFDSFSACQSAARDGAIDSRCNRDDDVLVVLGSSRPRRPSDLDVSVHGHEDPNAFGGLSWSLGLEDDASPPFPKQKKRSVSSLREEDSMRHM